MKKKLGFTLIEVMLAMGILTVSVFFISEILIKAILRIQANQDNIEKVFLIKRELYTNFLKRPLNEKKVINKSEDPKLTLSTTIEDINKKSSLKDYKDTIKIIETNAVWKYDNKFKESEMRSFVFRPKEKDAKK